MSMPAPVNQTTARPASSAPAAMLIDQNAPKLPPGVVKDLANVWTLYYRHGVNPGCFKTFYHEGDMRSAIVRIQKHCAVMGYRYVYIRPFMVDIDKEEADRAAVLNPASNT